jgi:thiol-disulfide isomerase/thioredoxin
MNIQNAMLKIIKMLAEAAVCLLLSIVFVTSVQGQKANPAPTTITGQLVCSDCWSEADRKTTPYGTPADLACARDCAERGIPSAIAVKHGDDYQLYLIEQEQFKQNRDEWLDRIGWQVEINGRPYAKKGKQYISVESYKFLSAATNTQQQASTVGSEVELSLKDLAGIDQRLSSYRGRIVVLNFWATWCVPCKQEMPDLAAIQNEYAAFGVQVVGASADQFSDRAKVVEFIRQTKINFPVWLGATTADMARFGVGPGLPATVVMGRDGKIVILHYKVIQQAQLKKEIDRLLSADSATVSRELAAAKKKPSSTNVSLVPS